MAGISAARERWRSALARGAFGALLLAWVFLASCDNGGAPPVDDGGPDFRFLPETDALTLLSTVREDFVVVADPPVTHTVQWFLDGEIIGVGPTLRFIPQALGPCVLRADASYEERSASYSWNLEIVNDHPLDFGFEPADSLLTMVDMEQKIFRVTTEFPFPVDFSWLYHGQQVGAGADLSFTAAGTGPDSLRVEYTAAGQLMSRTWRLDVGPYHPPAVGVVLVENEPWPGSVRVIWNAVDPVVFPLSDYLVAASFTGPIDEENWDEALLLGTVAFSDTEEWTRGLFTRDDGLDPGSYAWFAVRSRDEQGNLSEIEVNGQHALSAERWIEGRVSDELDNPLAGVAIRDNVLHLEDTTGADGRYRLGPFADFYAVTLTTVSRDEDLAGQPGTSWYDYRVEDLDLATDRSVDFRLLTRWGMDPTCGVFGGDFLVYMRNMTRTDVETVLRPDRRLYRWEEYPLDVYIPEFGNNGIDFKAACLQTLDWWNQTMGEEYYRETDDQENAQVVVVFGDNVSGANGQTSLLLPNDQPYGLGDVIPERVQVYLAETFSDEIRLQETCLHELGHALGVIRHAYCNAPGYLMYVTASGVLDDGWESAIHEDEQHLVRTIRYLPQGHAMDGYR